MSTATALLSAHALTKRFPGVVALREVSFDLRPGEIHALCGENGAGKSTLIKLLSGIHPSGSYEGELRIDGLAAEFHTIKDAERAGLAVIYQELALVEEMSVAENICLGVEPRRAPPFSCFIDWDRVHRDARTLLEQFSVRIDSAAPCSRLGVGEKQLVEIVKALGKKSRVLILDEPTAALAEHEAQILLTILRELRRRGLACIYISHKLDEVFAIADRITVLRDGASIVTFDAAQSSKAEVIRHMVGREITDLFPRRNRPAVAEHGAFLRDLIAHPEKTLALCTRGAQTILNADALVDLSPEYAALPREEQRVLHPQLHPVAQEACDAAFEGFLARAAAPDEVIHFTAGGPASGKSTYTAHFRGITYDSNLAESDHALRLIQLVLHSDRGVIVTYFHRPFAEAVDGNIRCYFDTGRAQTITRMADQHYVARHTFEKLRRQYANEPRLVLRITINERGNFLEVSPQQFAAEWPSRSFDEMAREGRSVVDAKSAAGEIDGGLAQFLESGVAKGTGGGAADDGRGESPRGGSAAAQHSPAQTHPRLVALRVEGLSVADPHTGRLRLHDISFTAAPGEVLGIGGLMGAGRTELLMHLFGAWGVRRAGRVELGAAELPQGLRPADILQRGLALVSEDRRRYGLVLEQTIGFNLSLSSLSRLTRAGLIDAGCEFRENDRAFRSLGIRAPGLHTVAGKLSGGNQQKVVVAKALLTKPLVIFLDEPTRGVDVGAKLEIYEIINQLTESGKAVVLVSSELSELIGMSDRILMLNDGRLSGEFGAQEATQQQLMRAAMGGRRVGAGMDE